MVEENVKPEQEAPVEEVKEEGKPSEETSQTEEPKKEEEVVASETPSQP